MSEVEVLVFPAPAGMNRSQQEGSAVNQCVPCARRDEPMEIDDTLVVAKCSLRPQG